ncbi:MAG: histidine kinase N-terminal 7TM domain-containing protein [Planctomycetota bacterium]
MPEALVFLLPYLASAVISAAIGVYAWIHRNAAARWFGAASFAHMLYTIGFIAETTSANPSWRITFDTLQWIPAVASGSLLIMFALGYTGVSHRRARRVGRVLVALFAFAVLVVISDPWLDLLRRDARIIEATPFDGLTYSFGPLCWLLSLAVFVQDMGLMLLIGSRAFGAPTIYRRQAVLILLGTALPFVGGILVAAGVSPWGAHRDTAPLTLALRNLLIAIALLRFGLLDLMPIARERFVEMTRDPIVVYDSGSRLVDLNPAALRLWNTDHDLIGRPVADALPDLIKAIAGGPDPDGHGADRTLSRDGRVFQVQTTPLGTADRGGTLTTLHDVTDVRRAEEEMRRRASSAEAHRDMLWRESMDLLLIGVIDGGLVQVNPAWQRLLGWSEAELLTHPITDYIAPDDVEATLALAPDLRAGGRVQNFVNRLRGTDNQYRTIQWNVRSLPDSGLLFGVGRDITEQRRMEQNVATAQRLEAVGRLAGGIAHDLNNTMTPVLCNASLLLEDPMPEQSLVMVREIAEAAARAATLTRHLLMFARRQPGGTPVPADLNVVVGNLQTLLVRSMPENIEVHFDLDESIPTFPGDTAGIELLITSLVSNARDAMPGGGRLTIATRGSQDSVTLTVADTGEGMDEATRRRAFEPFFTTRASGSGLGLPTVWGVAQQHGAQIELDTAPGQGARFELTFPSARPAPQLAMGSGEFDASNTHANTTDATGAEHVLLVEDDDPVRLATTRGLERLGYRVTAMRTGQEALAWQPDAPPDIVVADLVLPDMVGTTLCELLSERWTALKVVFVSGYDASDSTRRMAVAATATIQKPYTAVRLARAIRRTLDAAAKPL